jgi:hypothetical protein
VMPRAVRGLWPWATARVVITPAPRLATASWEVSSLPERGLGLGVTAASSRGVRQTLRAMNRSSPSPRPTCYQAWLFFMKPLHLVASAGSMPVHGEIC